MKLYDLATELDELVDQYNNVESSEELEHILQQLLTLDESFEVKLESCCRILKNYDVDIAGFKAEIDRITANMKGATSRQDSLKRYVKDCMKQAGKQKVKVGIFTPRIQANSAYGMQVDKSVNVNTLPRDILTWNPPCDGYYSISYDAVVQRKKMHDAWVMEYRLTHDNCPPLPAEIPEDLRIPEGIIVERGDHLRIG